MRLERNRESPATFVATARAVLSAFIGIRSADEHAAAPLAPVRVIAVGIACAALLVGTLIAVVRLVTG